MSSHSDLEIIKEFPGFHCMGLDKENILRRLGESWAPERVSDLIYEEPDHCWRLIRSISLEKPNDEALMQLGVTLGGLLREHPGVIELISQDVQETPQLAEVLSWVPEDEMIDSAVWSQIEFLSKSMK